MLLKLVLQIKLWTPLEFVNHVDFASNQILQRDIAYNNNALEEISWEKILLLILVSVLHVQETQYLIQLGMVVLIVLMILILILSDNAYDVLTIQKKLRVLMDHLVSPNNVVQDNL